MSCETTAYSVCIYCHLHLPTSLEHHEIYVFNFAYWQVFCMKVCFVPSPKQIQNSYLMHLCTP